MSRGYVLIHDGRSEFSLFGYIRPLKAELLVREYEQYRGIYCTLCRSMGRAYGRISRLTLSYDATFLVMVIAGLSEECPHFSSGRCVVNPMKKCLYSSGNGKAFEYAGALSILLTDAKLQDDQADGKLFAKIRAGFLRLLGSRSKKKAAKAYPSLAKLVETYVQAQRAVENQPGASLDASADPTARLLADAFRMLSPDDEKKALILEELGYFLGRWIYLIDAADDLSDDLKKGNFNPFIGYLSLQNIPLEGEAKRKAEETCNGVLNSTAARILPAFHLLEWNHFGPILENIVEKGLPEMQREILFLHTKEKKNV